MKMGFYKPLSLSTPLLLLASCFSLAAQQPYPDSAQINSQAAQSDAQQQISPEYPPQNPQTVSQTGLLPVYGVDLRLDPSWTDSSHFPSQSADFANSGTSAAFQQVWGALQPGGYSVLRVTLDVRNLPGAANRAANLCAWAKANNVRLILSLTAEDAGRPISDSFPKQTSDFVKALVGLMRSNSDQYLSNYAQIMAYQLGNELNHPGKHGGMSESAAGQLALAAAKSLRSTERAALEGSGIMATPLMASASFDFDLVSVGAIAGGTMSDANYNQAYQSLQKFLSGLAGSADLDILVVDWFAGSIGGGGIEKAPELLKSLLTDVAGKQLVLGTGFSTAFRSADEQKRLFTTAFANLSDFRASNGSDCPFVGTIFHEALSGSNPNPTPPRATLPAEMDNWDWTARAAELTAMWTKKKNSADMSWWLSRVENNMALVTLQSDASGKVVAANPLPAQQGMSQIATAVGAVSSQLASNLGAAPYANNSIQAGTATPNSPAGVNQNAYSPGQQQLQQAGLPSASAASPYSAASSNFGNQPQQIAANPYGAAPVNPSAQPACTPNYQGVQPSPVPYGQQMYGSQPATTAYPQQPATAMYPQQPATTAYPQQPATAMYPQQPATAAYPQQPTSAMYPQQLATTAYPQQPATAMYPQQPATACSPSGTVQIFQAFAQQSMMALLNGVLQRLVVTASGTGGAAFNNGNYSNTSPSNLANPGSPYTYYGGTPASAQPSPSTTPSQPAGTGPVTVQIGPQDVSIQPVSPQVGTPATINVNLHNPGSVDAYGLVVQAGGSDGATLAQQASVHVAPNSSLPLQLQWSPSAPSSSYGISISVSDGSGNQLTSAQVGPITVTAPVISNSGPSVTSSGSTVTATAGTTSPSGGSSTAGGTTTNCGTGATSGTATTGGPGAAASTAPACGTTSTLVSASTSASNSSNGTSANSGSSPGGAANGTGTSPITTSPLGSVKLSTIQVGIPGQPIVAGQASSVVVPLLNPYLVPLSNVTATLFLDGQNLQTQTMSTLLSQQSHTVIFQGVTFAPSGQHQISVNVTSQRPASDPLTSTTARQVTVVDASSATTSTAGSSSSSTSSGQSGATTSTASNTSTPSTTVSTVGNVTSVNASASVRSVLPQVFQIGRAVLPSRPGPSPSALPTATVGSSGSTPGAAPPRPAPPAGQTAAPPAATVSAPHAPPTGVAGVRSITSLPPRPGPAGTPQASSSGALVRPGPNGAVTPLTTPSNGIPVRPGPGGGQGALPAGPPKSGTSPASAEAGLDLSVSVPDISFNPTPLLPGQRTTFTAAVRNLGTTGTQSASVTFKLIAESGQTVASAPMTFSIPGRGVFQAVWTAVIPPGLKQLVVFVTANGDLNPANNQATVFFTVPAQYQLPRR